MKRSVWRYVLEIRDTQVVMMPEGADLLTADVQRGDLCVWALVDPEKPQHAVRVNIAGTGHLREADMLGRFVGTAVMMNGALVWHVFQG